MKFLIAFFGAAGVLFGALLTATCQSAGASADLGSGAQVRIVIVDSVTETAVPCRIHLKDEAGKSVQPKGLPFWHDHFVCPALAELELKPGRYTYGVDRGPEFLVTTGQLRVAEGTRTALTNRLRRMVDLSKEGWWSGELHVHRPLADIELLMRAEDLRVAPVITWWNDNSEWRSRAIPANLVVQFDANRFYHQMGGEDERGGGALLYFNLARPLLISGAEREYPSAMKFLAEAHRQEGAWVDIEKPFWYDTPIWLASGMVDSIGLAHNHMQRDSVMPNEAWGRARDTQRFPGAHGNGLWTQEIYYHILNCGLRLPPSAGSASGVLANPVGYDRVYVHLDGPLTYDKWWQGLKAGRVFVSNGPLLRCRANGQLPGYVFKSNAGGALDLNLEGVLDSRDPIASVEIVQNGRVVRSYSHAEWKRTGSLGTIGFEQSGWFLVRATAAVPNTFRFASTGPFYVDIGSTPARISRTSAQFFLDWVRARKSRIHLASARQQEEVLADLTEAEHFWEGKTAQANAD